MLSTKADQMHGIVHKQYFYCGDGNDPFMDSEARPEIMLNFEDFSDVKEGFSFLSMIPPSQAAIVRGAGCVIENNKTAF